MARIKAQTIGKDGTVVGNKKKKKKKRTDKSRKKSENPGRLWGKRNEGKRQK